MASKKGKAIEIAWKAAGKSEICFTEGIFNEANEMFAEKLRAVTGSAAPRMVLVADGNFVYHNRGVGSVIGKYLQTHGITLAAKPVVIGGGEKLKSDSLSTFLSVEGSVLDAKIGVGDVVVALGGGTIFDIAGMAAATARGGAKFVRIPTTPAAIVDGSFASYAALDSLHVKDAIRVPVRAACTIIDMALANSVLDGVWRGGLAEAVRYAVAADAKMLEQIAENAEALAKRDYVKMAEFAEAIVQQRAKRDIGDFAWWSAHCLEAASSYKLPHGYAIAIGTAIEAAYAAVRGVIAVEESEKVIATLRRLGALDGLFHSRHLIANVELLKRGYAEWRLGRAEQQVQMLAKIGKVGLESELDLQALERAVKEFLK